MRRIKRVPVADNPQWQPRLLIVFDERRLDFRDQLEKVEALGYPRWGSAELLRCGLSTAAFGDHALHAVGFFDRIEVLPVEVLGESRGEEPGTSCRQLIIDRNLEHLAQLLDSC